MNMFVFVSAAHCETSQFLGRILRSCPVYFIRSKPNKMLVLGIYCFSDVFFCLNGGINGINVVVFLRETHMEL